MWGEVRKGKVCGEWRSEEVGCFARKSFLWIVIF